MTKIIKINDLIKKLKYKIVELESEIIRKDNLIEGMKKIIEDLSTK